MHIRSSDISRGNQHFQRQDFAGAVLSYRRALQQQPDARIFHNLAVSLSRLERWDEARVAYEESLALRPFDANTRNNLGMVYKELGQLFGAEKILRSLLSDDPWNIDVATNLAGVLLEQGRPDVGIELLRPIVQRAGRHPLGWDTLGACFLDGGDLDMALACFARSHEQQPNNPTPLFHIFAPLFERDSNSAVELLQRGLKQHPDRWDWSWLIQCVEQWDRHKNDDGYDGDIASSPSYTHDSMTVTIPHTPPHWIDSWNYALEHRTFNTQLFSTTATTLRYAMELCCVEGLCLEFGTRFGTSAKILQEGNTRTLFAFDSFEGLPTAWHTVPKGAYSTGGLVPNLGNSIQPIVGWYSESLPPFLKQYEGPIRLLHIDCDLYSSTKDVFDVLHDRLVRGTVIIFDEYWMGPHWREDEWKAWQECCTTHNIQYEYKAFTLLTQQAVIQIVQC